MTILEMNLKVELLFHYFRQFLEQIDPVESNCTSTYSTYEALFSFLACAEFQADTVGASKNGQWTIVGSYIFFCVSCALCIPHLKLLSVFVCVVSH